RKLDDPVDVAVGRVAHDAAAAPVRAPDTTVDIHRRAVGRCTFRYLCKVLPSRQSPFGLYELVHTDQASGRVGKVQTCAVGAEAQAVGNLHTLDVTARRAGAPQGVQAATGRRLTVLNH